MKFRQLDKHASCIFVKESHLTRGLVATMHDRSDVSQTCADMARDVTPEEAERYQSLFSKAPEMYELLVDLLADYTERIPTTTTLPDRIRTLLAEIEG
jgi:hypothetical protein